VLELGRTLEAGARDGSGGQPIQQPTRRGATLSQQQPRVGAASIVSQRTAQQLGVGQ